MHAPDIRADKLIHEMKAVVRDTEDLLKATAGDASERATKALAQAEESLRHARASLADMEQHLDELRGVGRGQLSGRGPAVWPAPDRQDRP